MNSCSTESKIEGLEPKRLSYEEKNVRHNIYWDHTSDWPLSSSQPLALSTAIFHFR